MNGTLAKVLGWAQFGIFALHQAFDHGMPHGYGQWVVVVASLVLAIGSHANGNGHK